MNPSVPDRILIAAIDCVTAIGVTASERAIPQRLLIDVELQLDTRQAAASDSLSDALDYAEVAQAVQEVCQSRDFHLIETVADRIARLVLDRFPVPEVRVLVRKTSPVLDPRVSHVSVEITRHA